MRTDVSRVTSHATVSTAVYFSCVECRIVLNEFYYNSASAVKLVGQQEC